MNSPTLGEEIKRLRTMTDVTLRGFAVKLGISASHLSDIEHDRRRPSLDLLQQIAQRLAHVGASFEKLRAMNTSVDPATQEWVSKTQYVGEMLRKARDSGVRPEKIIELIEKERQKGKGKE